MFSPLTCAHDNRFLPKGASIFMYFNEELERGAKGRAFGDVPPRLDWDLLNHIGYIRTHWLPRPKSSFDNNGNIRVGQGEVDLEAFIRLVENELDFISHTNQN